MDKEEYDKFMDEFVELMAIDHDTDPGKAMRLSKLLTDGDVVNAHLIESMQRIEREEVESAEALINPTDVEMMELIEFLAERLSGRAFFRTSHGLLGFAP